MVFVRKGAVVWQLRVATIPLQFQATEAQMVAVLETYAAKQKSRVGTGWRPSARGARACACAVTPSVRVWASYGGIYLQLDAFAAPTSVEKDLAKT